MSIWPWSDLIHFVMMYSRPTGKEFSVLELGCGAGANIPFFKSLGIKYFGVEGSESIIKKLREKYPELKDNLIAEDFTEDFTKDIPFDQQFDLIIDRDSITHNPTNGIKNCIEIIKKKLKNDGSFIGIDWFSTKHSDFKKGESTEDEFTKGNFSEGQFVGIGKVHFSDKEHLLELFKDFNFISIKHKFLESVLPEEDSNLATWSFVVKNR